MPLMSSSFNWQTVLQQSRWLLRAGGLALGWPQLGISFIAVAVFWPGLSSLERWSPRETLEAFPPKLIHFHQVIDHPEWKTLETDSWEPARFLVAPWRAVAEPIYELLFTDPHEHLLMDLPPQKKSALLARLIFSAMVWSLFGMAICRAVAVQMSRDRGDPLPEVMRYSVRRWLLTLGAPSIPAGGILAVMIGVVLAAWWGRLPLIGGPVLTVFSPLLFLAGLVIAVLALTILCGWPLMVAAMSVEDCDGFGAFSRSFSFLTGRPAIAIAQALVSLAYGYLLVALVGRVFTLALLAAAGPLSNIGGSAKWESVLQGSHFAARFLFATYAVSLFWTLVTGNYLLLRLAVDGKPQHDIAAEERETVPRDLPIVGIPATPRPLDENSAEQANPVATT